MGVLWLNKWCFDGVSRLFSVVFWKYLDAILMKFMGISSVFCFKSGSTGFLGLMMIDFEYISMVFKYSFIDFIHVSTVFWLCCEGISSVFVSTIVDDACVYMVRYLFGVPFFFQEVFQGCLMGVTRLPCCTRLKYYKKLCLLLLLLVLYLSFNQLPSSVEFSNFPLIFLPNQYFYSFSCPWHHFVFQQYLPPVY